MKVQTTSRVLYFEPNSTSYQHQLFEPPTFQQPLPTTGLLPGNRINEHKTSKDTKRLIRIFSKYGPGVNYFQMASDQALN